MIEDIASKLAQATLGTTVAGGGTVSPLPAGSNDVERFRLAMTNPLNSSAQAGSVLNVQVPQEQAAVAASRPAASGTASAGTTRKTVGDAILDSFTSAANNVSVEWKDATQAIMGKSMSAGELLQVQVKLINVSFQLDLISKGISKTTSNLEQTLKTQ